MEHLPDVYDTIVNMVTENSRVLFHTASIDEEVLENLKKIWQTKILEREVVSVTSAIPCRNPPKSLIKGKLSQKRNEGSRKASIPKKMCCNKIDNVANFTFGNAVKATVASSSKSMPLLDSDDEDINWGKQTLDGTKITNITVERKVRVPEPNIKTTSTERNSPPIKNDEKNIGQLHTYCTLKVPVKYRKMFAKILVVKLRRLSLSSIRKKHCGKAGRDTKGAKTNSLPVKLARVDNKLKEVLNPSKNGNSGETAGSPTKMIITRNSRIKYKQDATLIKRHCLERHRKNVSFIEEALKSYTKQRRNCSKSSNKTSTLIQLDGPSDKPKFQVKSKVVDISVGVNQERFAEEELNSDDDPTDDELSSELFESDNIIVCQYENVKRTKNRFQINLKHGVMHLNEKDYVFHTAKSSVKW